MPVLELLRPLLSLLVLVLVLLLLGESVVAVDGTAGNLLPSGSESSACTDVVFCCSSLYCCCCCSLSSACVYEIWCVGANVDGACILGNYAVADMDSMQATTRV